MPGARGIRPVASHSTSHLRKRAVVNRWRIFIFLLCPFSQRLTATELTPTATAIALCDTPAASRAFRILSDKRDIPHIIFSSLDKIMFTFYETMFIICLSPPTLAATSTIEILSRDLTVREIRDLDFGQVFRPESGAADANFGLICTGTSTQVTGTGAGLATGSNADRACGEIEVDVGDIDRTFTLSFGGSAATDVASGGNALETIYTLYDDEGNGLIADFAADGTTVSGPTGAQSGVASGPPISYYIGGSVVLADDSPIAAYTGTYEIIATEQ